ncbi:hypothetical protein FOZ60_012045, partial [Perkinsus olseni]
VPGRICGICGIEIYQVPIACVRPRKQMREHLKAQIGVVALAGPYEVLKANTSGTIYQLTSMPGTTLRYLEILEALLNLRGYRDPPRVIVPRPAGSDNEPVVEERDYDGLHPEDSLHGIEGKSPYESIVQRRFRLS